MPDDHDSAALAASSNVTAMRLRREQRVVLEVLVVTNGGPKGGVKLVTSAPAPYVVTHVR